MDEMDDALDDELLKELGLEPKKPAPPKAAQPLVKPPPPPPQRPVPQKAPMTAKPVPQKTEASEAHFTEGVKNLSKDMPVSVVAVLGKKTMSLAEVISLKQGELIDFKKLPQESVDLVANGKLVARGDLVVIDGKLGVQVKQLVG